MAGFVKFALGVLVGASLADANWVFPVIALVFWLFCEWADAKVRAEE